MSKMGDRRLSNPGQGIVPSCFNFCLWGVLNCGEDSPLRAQVGGARVCALAREAGQRAFSPFQHTGPRGDFSNSIATELGPGREAQVHTVLDAHECTRIFV